MIKCQPDDEEKEGEDMKTIWYRARAELCISCDGEYYYVNGAARDALENSLRGLISRDEQECIIRRYIDSIHHNEDNDEE